MSVSGVGASLGLLLVELEGRTRKPRVSRIRRDETTPHRSSKHCRGQRVELSCSSRASPAFPSVRIDSSSCGSRLALPQSSERFEPHMPSPVPRRTAATAGQLRIGAGISLDKNIPRVEIPTTAWQGLRRLRWESRLPRYPQFDQEGISVLAQSSVYLLPNFVGARCEFLDCVAG